MNSDQTCALSGQAVPTANKAASLDNNKHTADTIMDKQLNSAGTDFSKDQSEDTGFSFSNNVSENGKDCEPNHETLAASEPLSSTEKFETSSSGDSKNLASSTSSNEVSKDEMSNENSTENNSGPEEAVPLTSDRTVTDTEDSKEVNDKTPSLENHAKNNIDQPESSNSVQDILKVNTLIDDIMKKSGLDGGSEDEETVKEAEKPDTIKGKETGEKSAENHEEINNDKVAEGTSDTNPQKVEVHNQAEDDGEGTLYIDEGQEKQPSDDSDGEVKKKKDILDTDTEEEEEDEDEKAFGVSIKEKKKKIKQAMGNKPVEKIDLETFKSEWSDEDEGTEETEKTQNDASKAATETPSTVSTVPGNNNNDVDKDISTIHEDIELGESGEILEESMDSEENSTHETVDVIVAHDAMKSEPIDVEQTHEDATVTHTAESMHAHTEAVESGQVENSEGTAKQAHADAEANMEDIAVEGTQSVEAAGSTADVNTSDNTDEMEASMLIEEISQDDEALIKEEAIVVIGGSNGENLADFVIVNENNEEQEIFEEIAEDGSKTYYVKVKQTSEAAASTNELEPEVVEHHETSEMIYTAGPESKNAEIIRTKPKNKKPRFFPTKKSLEKNPDMAIARDIALKQLESPELKSCGKRMTRAPPPALQPIQGRKNMSQVEYEEKTMKIKLNLPSQDPDPDLPQSKQLLEKLELTVQLRNEEKRQREMKNSPVSAKPSNKVPRTIENSTVKPLKTSNAEVVAEKALKKPAVKVESPHKKPRFVTPVPTSQENIEQVPLGDVTPSRKSTRLKIENQTLKDYAVEMPSAHSMASTIMVVSKSPVKAGRPPKRRLESAHAEIETAAAAKRFIISYANKKRPSGGEPEGPNPVIPPLIVENGKDIVDRLLSGDQRSKRLPRGQSSGPAEDLIIVEASKKKKMKEFDASLIPSAREIQENQESSVVAETQADIPTTEAKPTEESSETPNEIQPIEEATIPMPPSPKLNPSARGQRSLKQSPAGGVVLSRRPKAKVLVDVKTKIPANTWNVEASEEGTEDDEETIRDGPGHEAGELSAVHFKSRPVGDVDKKRQSKMNREVNSLLGDEGAINMLYSVTQRRNRSQSVESTGDISTNSNLKKRKSLQMKANLVKNAVMNMSSSLEDGVPSSAQGRLRKKAVKSPLVKTPKSLKRRKMSADSARSSLSLQSESVIFRRHSEDSSSGEEKEVEDEEEDQQGSPSTQASPADHARKLKHTIASKLSHLTKKSTTKVPTSPQTPKAKKSATPIISASSQSESKSTTSSDAAEVGTKKKITTSANDSIADESGTNASKVIEEVEQELESLFAGEEETAPVAATETNTAVEQAETEKAPIQASAPSQPTQPGRPGRKKSKTPALPPPTKQSKSGKAKATEKVSNEPTEESDRMAMDVVDNSEPSNESNEQIVESANAGTKSASVGVSESASAGAKADSDDVNVISVKICDDLAYITFLNQSKQNCFTVNILNELTATLVYLDSQDACKAILMMGAGFASGVDLSYLVCDNRNKRRRNATSMANAVKQFISTLAQLGKPILLGVSGQLIGAAVTILPLFDFVLAEATASFSTLYPRLGQIPEGAATFTFPMFLGRNATSELLLNCRKLSAQEAKSLNLVTRVCSADTFEKTAESWARDISKYSAQSMQTTKLLLRKDLYSQLNETLNTETDFLIEHWTSDEVQRNLKKHLSSLK